MVWGNQPSGVRPDEQPEVTTSGSIVVADFGVLMVCTGNVCRSPMAEQMLGAALTRGLGETIGSTRAAAVLDRISVTSAGTSAHDGDPMTPESIAESERVGGGGRSHLAHRLDAADVASASLILGMTAEHRKAAAKLDPRAARRSFTLLEFARLLALPQLLDDVVRDRRESGDGAGDPIASLDSFVSTVAASRGYLPPPAHASDLDITDPYGRSAKVYAQVASIIGEATTTLADSFVSVVKQT